MEEKKKRPAIPENVKRELWIKSGGRCEFRGCNKYLYKDGVTKQPRNLANIAHIVSWTPTGPRGNQNSEKLATDISNLMLTCSEHNNLIDDPRYVEMYPVELLQQYKSWLMLMCWFTISFGILKMICMIMKREQKTISG